MSDFTKSVLWTVIITAFLGILFVVILVTNNTLLPPTMPIQAQPLPKQAEVAKAPFQSAQQAPVPFVVFPGKFVGNFLLGMSKRDALKIAPKPQQNSADRLVYKSQKTGNSLIARFQKNRLVQIDFTSKDFYTEEGIHPGNFRDAQYATLFNVEELPGTSPRLKYSLKTGGLIFYGNSDALPGAIGVVYAGPQPLYAVQSMQTTAQIKPAGPEPAQPVQTSAQLEKEIFARIKEETKAQTAMPVRPAQPAQTPAPAQKEEATPLQINASNIGAYVIAGKLLQQYAILQQAPGYDMMPICMQAGAIAQAFLMAQDAERYNEWKARQDFNCKTFRQ